VIDDCFDKDQEKDDKNSPEEARGKTGLYGNVTEAHYGLHELCLFVPSALLRNFASDDHSLVEGSGPFAKRKPKPIDS
jgi:hypothetical protein